MAWKLWMQLGINNVFYFPMSCLWQSLTNFQSITFWFTLNFLFTFPQAECDVFDLARESRIVSWWWVYMRSQPKYCSGIFSLAAAIWHGEACVRAGECDVWSSCYASWTIPGRDSPLAARSTSAMSSWTHFPSHHLDHLWMSRSSSVNLSST